MTSRDKRGRIRILTVALLAAVAVVGTPAAALADVADSGLWYFDALNVQAAHDAGITGEGVTIAVLDTPANLDVPTLSTADIQVQDSTCYLEDGSRLAPVTTDVDQAGHGTNVLSMIVGSGAGYNGQRGVKGVAPDARILFYLVSDADGSCLSKEGARTPATAAAIDAAVLAGADIISVSIGEDRSPEISNSVINALNAGVVLVMGVSNQDGNLVPGFGIAGFNGVVGVQAFDKNGNLSTHDDLQGGRLPNLDSDTEVVAPGVGILFQGGDTGWEQQRLINGTSFATPIVAGFLADVAQKFPEATGNQLIQTLISNTGGGGDAAFDETGAIGWGSASLTNMLTADPSQYPDVNPLIRADGTPTPAEIAAGPDTAETFVPDPVAPPDGNSLAGVLVAVLAVLSALVVAGVVVAVLVTRSRRKRQTTQKRNGGA